MEIDNLLNQIDSTEVLATQDNTMKEYLGKNYSVDEIDKLDEKEMKKLYARYEASLGGHTTKLLKEHIISAYNKAVELTCLVISQERLAVSDTNEMCKSLYDSPFIELALTSLTSV